VGWSIKVNEVLNDDEPELDRHFSNDLRLRMAFFSGGRD
jgi:hypothetical protein